jgi:hypothetical protein
MNPAWRAWMMLLGIMTAIYVVTGVGQPEVIAAGALFGLVGYASGAANRHAG